MARIAIQAAMMVAILGVALNYFGLLPASPGLQMFLPRLGGAAPRNINAPKLLTDLNNDVLEPGSGSPDEDSDGPQALAARVSRASSAALSFMYLASLPGLKEQVKGTPGVVESLVRRLMTVDMAEARRLLVGQQQDGGSGVAAAQAELLSSALLAVAKLAADDRPLQAWLLGDGDGIAAAVAAVGGQRSGKVPAAVRAAKPLPPGVLLARLGEALHSGVPAWQAAASVLLHSLSGAGGVGSDGRVVAEGHPRVLSWAAERAVDLVRVGRSLVEAGAHFNSSDAVLAGAQLLEVVAVQPDGRRLINEGDAPPLLVQVVLSYGGTNSSSPIVGAAVRLLHRLLAVAPGGGGEGPSGAEAAASRLAQSLASRGLVAPLVREIRLGAPASLGPSLELLVDLLRREEGEEQEDWQGGGGGSGGGDEGAAQVAREAVGAGILSLCAQLLFKASPDTQARSACCWIVRHMVAHSELRRSGSGGEGGDAGGVRDAHPTVSASGSAGDGLCGVGDESRVALARDLLRMIRGTDLADLHNAVLDACRDVAPARPAAMALTEAGAVPLLALLLSHNTTQSAEAGALGGSNDAATNAWLLHSQRSAAAVVALLALQRDLRPRLVAEGALTGLATALRVQAHAGRQGLGAQVRVTAAAALVPLLGDDGRYIQLAVAAGALGPLVDMHFSDKAQEVQVADRVLRILGADPEVAGMFESVGFEL